MAQGDHLSVGRGLYTHHGIDMGGGQVAQYGRDLESKANAEVEIVSRARFSDGQPVRIVRSPVHYSPEEIVQRARSRVGERAYDLVDNNCEAFVAWCRTGVAESCQVRIAEACTARAASIGSKCFFWPAFVRTAGQSTSRRAVGALTRRSIPSLLAADAVQGGVEVLALRSGRTQSESQRLARHSGLATAASVGLVTGGPAGAAAGIVGWMTGDWIGRSAVTTSRRVVRLAAECHTANQPRSGDRQ